MSTLIIVTHPNMGDSIVHKKWVEELKKYPEKYTVRDLYNEYPDGNIDVAREQTLIEEHDDLVLQFPIYWFNCPPLLKKWLDEVLLYGWAYGSKGDKLKNRKIALGVSAGIKQEDYSQNGTYKYTLEEILAPFEITAHYCKADYRSFFALYNTESGISAEDLEKSTRDYMSFIDQM
ncbi:NAD(P)H-dependent oxidoreductase [Paenibacillus paeoniae]|uniref:Flavodoxin family protein n=1 Tax=Paenibacillus paeoniae TaxID=2292705 RepID=A0A371PGE9_9BACL|nr:NAD(P)H-dependent oxidoreductase [Paenibacillus paeoniae]REK74686.1 flavodoxin family protein [Paenibacillus paeoniae]